MNFLLRINTRHDFAYNFTYVNRPTRVAYFYFSTNTIIGKLN